MPGDGSRYCRAQSHKILLVVVHAHAPTVQTPIAKMLKQFIVAVVLCRSAPCVTPMASSFAASPRTRRIGKRMHVCSVSLDDADVQAAMVPLVALCMQRHQCHACFKQSQTGQGATMCTLLHNALFCVCPGTLPGSALKCTVACLCLSDCFAPPPPQVPDLPATGGPHG